MAAKKKAAKPKNKQTSLETLDPRKAAFLVAYTDPKSKTFGNALQSALGAGYSQEYAESITTQMPDWLAENLGNMRRVHLAEKHLDEVLEMPIITQAMGAFGPIFEKKEKFVTVTLKNGKKRKRKEIEKVPIMVHNTSLIKEKTNVVKFTLEALDKARFGRQGGARVSFNFNVKAVKDKYRTP